MLGTGRIGNRFNIFAWLRKLTDSDIGILLNLGVPVNGTSGTFAGFAGKGCLLIDATNSAFYINTNTKASPTWTFLGGVFGSGGAQGVPGLTISSQTGAVGNGADTTDDTLYTFTLPANSLNANNRGIYIFAWGVNGATANNKTVKLFWGSQTIVTSGVITTNGGAWSVEAYIVRSAAGAQQIDAFYMNGAALSVQTNTAGTQNETLAIVIKVTGASPTTGAANDIVGNGFVVETIN